MTVSLSNKERFLRVARGEDVDCLPIQCDFTASGLKRYLLSRSVSNTSDLELLRFFDNHVLYGFMNGATLQMKTLDYGDADIIYDEWGCGWDTKVDLHYKTHPLSDMAAYEQYKLPDPNAPGYLDYAEKIIRDYGEEYAVTSYHFCCLFERAYILRGFENALVDLALADQLFFDLLDQITRFQVELAKRYVKIGVSCGRIVDDYGAQNGLLMSPDSWREVFKPRLAQIYAIYKNANIPVIHHSCGDITAIIPDLIEIGMDVLNPVQPKALDITAISKEFGDKIAFFGGVCNQEVLPFGTLETIDSHVGFLVDTLGAHGRYVIAPSNGIGPDVPLENIAAFYQAALKYRQLT